MDKYNLTKYATEKYGVDESIAETFANMFSDCMMQLIKQTNESGKPMQIQSIAGNSVLLSKKEYESLRSNDG